MGTAIWRGVRLADVLRLAGPRLTAKHVVPDGHDAPPTPQAPDFIRSHPIWKAMEPHTMIALEMNGKPVPHLHGGPARLIVPGWVGSASIKWLIQLTLAEKEWSGPFMQRSYRSPQVDDPSQTYSLHHLIEACGETGCPVCRCLIDKHDHRSRTPFTEREAASWSEALGFLAGQAEPFGNEVPRAAGEPHGKRG